MLTARLGPQQAAVSAQGLSIRWAMVLRLNNEVNPDLYTPTVL